MIPERLKQIRDYHAYSEVNLCGGVELLAELDKLRALLREAQHFLQKFNHNYIRSNDDFSLVERIDEALK